MLMEKDKLLNSFFKCENHRKLLVNYKVAPTYENKRLLNLAFKKYYTNIRFVSYVAKTLHFTAINFDKKLNSINQNEQLKENYIENLSRDKFSKEKSLFEEIDDYELSRIFLELSDKQKEVLNLVYYYGFKEKEIAKLMNQSQQSISALKVRAIKKLRQIRLDKK